jgi:hypothetical protein
MYLVDFEIRAWCVACGEGTTVATFGAAWCYRRDDTTPFIGSRPAQLARVCRCGADGLRLEVVQTGQDGLEWLSEQPPGWAAIYLTARRVGACHADAVMAANAVRLEPGACF